MDSRYQNRYHIIKPITHINQIEKEISKHNRNIVGDVFGFLVVWAFGKRQKIK
jgi:hypothetical protein